MPSGIATDDTTKLFFQDIIDNKCLVSLYDFRNKGFFLGVASAQGVRFCLLTIAGDGCGDDQPRFLSRGEVIEEMFDPARTFSVTADDIALLNPNTRTCPVFRTARDAEVTKDIYRRIPVMLKEGPPAVNPWGLSFQRMFDMANDSGLFRMASDLAADGWSLDGNVFRKDSAAYLPLYEAKMLHHYDHRWATYTGTDSRDVTRGENSDPHFMTQPRYWVSAGVVLDRVRNRLDRDWLIAWRDITSNLDFRTTISGILPRVGVGHTSPIMLPKGETAEIVCLYSSICSFAFDYVSRQKIGGTHLTYGLMNQLPVLPPTEYSTSCPWEPDQTLAEWIKPRVLELTYTAWDLKPFAEDCGYTENPFVWDDDRRFQLRCELDAAFFHLYGISEADAEYIMETFPIVKAKDMEAHGTYRTKDTILAIYREMATGRFSSPLTPPPGVRS